MHRRRQPRLALGSVDQDRVTDTLQPACDLVFVLDHNSACLGMRVIKQLGDRIDGGTGNADARQRIVPVRDGMLRNRGLDVTNGFLAMRDPIRIGPEFRIIDDRIQSGDATKLAP